MLKFWTHDQEFNLMRDETFNSEKTTPDHDN